MKNKITNFLKELLRIYYLTVFCSRHIHYDTKHFDEDGICGEWRCNICGYYSKIRNPPPMPICRPPKIT